MGVLWSEAGKMIPYVQRSEHVFIYSTLLDKGHIYLWLQRFLAQGKLWFLRQ